MYIYEKNKRWMDFICSLTVEFDILILGPEENSVKVIILYCSIVKLNSLLIAF